ncbi:MAG: TRAP transporter small permease subunit [Pseudomonadota bacterium]
MTGSALDRAASILDRIAAAIAWIGKMACWLLLAILAVVLLSILGGVLRVTHFADWEGEIFLLGSGITLNSVLEMQWYLFGVLLMLTGAYALHLRRHVRVDVLSSRFSPRTALWVEILGDLIFLLPLCLVLLDRSLPLLELSYRMSERSNEDGLTHRWVVKAFVPIGFGLLATFGAVRILRNILTLCGARPPVVPPTASESAGELPATPAGGGAQDGR